MRISMLATGAVALAASAAPAAAHVHLDHSVPAAGARMQRPPAAVTLWFSAPLEARRATVRVTDGEGAAIPAAPSQRPGDRRMRVALRGRNGKPGTWIAEYRILAADGHTAAGTVGFEVAGVPAGGARPRRPRTHGEPLAAAGPPAAAMGAARAAENGAMAFVIGGLAFLVLCTRRTGGEWRRPFVVAGVAGVLSSGTALALHALDPAVAGDVLATRAGTALLCAHLLWIAVALALVHAPPLVAIAVAAPLVVCPGVAGHAGGHALLVPASALHVGAMAVWLGGLAGLWRAVRSARRDGREAHGLARAASRFSGVALACAAAVLATGVVQSATLVAAPSDLVGTAHGRLLALKALVFAGFVAVGLRQRRTALPKLQTLAAAGAAPRDAAARLSGALRAELALAAAVLGLAGALAVADPAAARIDPGAGIGRARIGMSEKTVRAKLGAPSRVARDDGATILVYERRKLVVTLLGGRVRIVSTRHRRERTPEGVGVGTTRRALLRKVRRARCRVEAGTRFCVVGSTRRGRSTVFLIRSGRVHTVSIARA